MSFIDIRRLKSLCNVERSQPLTLFLASCNVNGYDRSTLQKDFMPHSQISIENFFCTNNVYNYTTSRTICFHSVVVRIPDCKSGIYWFKPRWEHHMIGRDLQCSLVWPPFPRSSAIPTVSRYVGEHRMGVRLGVSIDHPQTDVVFF